MISQLILLMKFLTVSSYDAEATIGSFLSQIKIEPAEGELIHLKLVTSCLDCICCFPALRSMRIASTVPLWQHLALQKTRLMLQHDGGDPYFGILAKFQDNSLTESQLQEINRLEVDKKDQLKLLLNEFIIVYLVKEDFVMPHWG